MTRLPGLVTGARFMIWMALFGLTITPSSVFAHDGQPPTPDTLWQSWNWEPLILVGLAFGAGAYIRGSRVLWGHVAQRRLSHRWRTILIWRATSFFSGLGVLCLALLSPLDALSLALFSAHMSQHMALILLAAPLLILGDPRIPFLIFSTRTRRALGRWWKQARLLRSLWRGLAYPPVVWSLHALALWAWHVPSLYQAALQSEFIHMLEHLSLLGTALLFWWVIASPPGNRWIKAGHLDRGVAVLYLFTTALQSGILGVLITFAPNPWYPANGLTTTAWGLTPLEDQQLAGAIMWIPAGVAYTVAALGLFMAWLASAEQEACQRETRLYP